MTQEIIYTQQQAKDMHRALGKLLAYEHILTDDRVQDAMMAVEPFSEIGFTNAVNSANKLLDEIESIAPDYEAQIKALQEAIDNAYTTLLTQPSEQPDTVTISRALDILKPRSPMVLAARAEYLEDSDNEVQHDTR